MTIEADDPALRRGDLHGRKVGDESGLGNSQGAEAKGSRRNGAAPDVFLQRRARPMIQRT
jgi:hypothetical protein